MIRLRSLIRYQIKLLFNHLKKTKKTMQDGTLGEIRMFGGNFAPQYWAYCQGQSMSISVNTALFSILGTIYGGDGQQTFNLPDLRGRVPVGTGQGVNTDNVVLGAKSGNNNVALTTTNMPAHTHAATISPLTAKLNAATTNASIATPTAGSSLATPGSLSGRTFTPSLGYDTAAPSVGLNANSVTISGGSIQVGISGSGLPFSIMPPYLGMNYIICIQGMYPSRN
jgi:microcystin-dependent protein